MKTFTIEVFDVNNNKVYSQSGFSVDEAKQKSAEFIDKLFVAGFYIKIILITEDNTNGQGTIP